MAASIIAALPDALVRFGATLGLNDRALREACGMSPGAPEDPDQLVPFSVVTKLWQLLAAVAPDKPLGLQFGQTMNWGNLGILGHIVRHSPTVGSGLEALGRYHRLIDGQLTFEVDRTQARGTVTLGHEESIIRLGYHLEAIIFTIIRGCSEVASEPVPLEEIWFEHELRGNLADYEAAFQCPVKFGRKKTIAFVPSEWLNKTNRIADLSLRRYLEKRAAQMLAALPETVEATWLDTVRDAIRTGMRQGNPSANEVANQMTLSVRTLQRRLSENDTSFANLLQEVRQAEAEELLAYTRTPVFEVAFRLGYDDSSSFFRAFKRWTGLTPEAYREQRQAKQAV